MSKSQEKVVNIIESGDYTKLEKEFLHYYWNSIKQDYLMSLDRDKIWLPGLGLFKLKPKKMRRFLSTTIKILQEEKNGYRGQKYNSLLQKFKIVWKHYDEYKKNLIRNTALYNRKD